MRAKRILTAALLGALLALLGAAPALAAIGIVLGGEELSADPAPRMVNGRVLVPLRLVSESLNAQVDYQAGNISITAADGTQIALKVGSKQASKTTADGASQQLSLDSPAKLYGDSTFVPLRFVAEALGAQVEWQAAKQQVSITPAKFVDPDPIFTNAEGKQLHSMTDHWYMTMGGKLTGYWGHKQVGEAWRLLVDSRGKEVPEPQVPYSSMYNLDWNYFYYLDREVGFYSGDPVYDEGGDETADYFFEIYHFKVNFDDGSVKVPGANDGEYLIRDMGTNKWYVLAAANHEAFMNIKFPANKTLVNNIV